MEIDDQDASTTLQDLKAESKEINKELRRMAEAGEEGSEVWKDLKVRQKEVNAEMLEFTRNIDVNDASMNELNSRSRLLNKELRDLKVGSEEWLEKLEKVREVDDKIDEVKKSVKGLGDEVDKQPSMWESMKTSILAVFTGTGLLELAKEAATAIFEFGKEVFETTAKFEKYETVLRVALGSQAAAVKAMEDIKKMAAETPFSVDELTESYVKYVNRGLTPTMAEMTKMGDIAASQGKSFDQLTEAILDATTGEFERLKEFGIQASKSNGEVELSFKGVTTVVKDQPEAIRQAMLAFGELEGVQGGMAETSKTLEGRVSNLGDNFDSLKILIGEGLKPVFGFLIDAMSFGIEIFKEVWSASDPIVNIFKQIFSIVENLYGSVMNLIGQFVDLNDTGGIVKFVMEQLATSFRIAYTGIMFMLTGIQAGVDGLNILVNKGKEVANYFGANFKIDPKANFDTLQQNADKNFKAIQNAWTNTQNAAVKTHEDSTKKQTDTHAKGQAQQTLAEKKEAEKREKEREKQAKKDEKEAEKVRKAEEKAESDLIKKIDDMKVKAIKDDQTRKIAEIKLSYEREKKAIEQSKGLEKDKAEVLTLLKAKMEADVAKTEEDFRKKKETDEDNLRKKTAAEEKRLRDERLKESKALFDSEFQAEVAKAQNALDLTSTNSKAQWDAKRNLLEIEKNYKIQKLQEEAAAEKARIADSIKDTESRATAVNNIDTELKAKMSSAEQKFQNDKTRLNDEQNKAREKNNEEFFDALKKAGDGDLKSTLEFLKKKAEEDQKHNKDRKEDRVKLKDAIALLMKGDTELFLKYLAQKVKTDADGNATQLQNFADKTQKVADGATQAINFLKDLNQKYLEWEISKIKKEEQEQLDSWKREYDSGKISKEEFEKGNVKITEESKKRELAARKDAFEREKKMNIAAAVINTAQAALKSFAMFGWPIGLVMAALAAVAGGIQIAAISRQQFQGAKGGVVNSDGKIFAQSGAVVPRNAFVAQGDAHGASYGFGGISMINRRTGHEVGEIEGGEPVMVLSKNTYQNNGKLIDRLLHSSLYQNGAPVSMARGGVLMASGARMFEDGGVVDTGVNVDGMMSENKKSQETMEKMRDNTGKTVEGIDNLSRVMQKSQQQGGAINAQVANAFMGELKHMGDILQGIEREQINTRTVLGKTLNNTFDMLKSNHTSISDTTKTRLKAIEDMLQKIANNDRSQLESISNTIIALLKSNTQSIVQIVKNEALAERNLKQKLNTDDARITENLANLLFNFLRSSQQSNQQLLKNEMRTARELSEKIHYESTLLSERQFRADAENTEYYHTLDARQRNSIFVEQRKLAIANENARHQDAMNDMMLMRMISQELNWHSVLLNDIKNKPDGSYGILHAIDRLAANTAKSNLK